LATPHEPVLVLDRYTREFYDTVNAFWNNTSSAASLSHLTFVSIGGGERDILVRSGLTSSSHADVNVISTDASGIWVSADHLCIVWCKQLVLALNRALFDVIGKQVM
jgi:glycosylphosphatidylinositol deacylase